MADPSKPGVDWNALIGLIAPAVGTYASRGGGADQSFMGAYRQSEHAIQQESLRKQQEEQHRQQLSAEYLLKIGEHAQGLEDPIDFQNFVRLAEDAGTKAGYTKPGELSSKLTFSSSKQAERQLRELTDQLDGLSKQGYDLNALAESGQFLETKGGKRVPIGEALKLTRRQPLDASGQTIAPPKKQDVNAATDYGRWLAKWARDKGKTVDTLTAGEELQAKQDYGDAGRSTTTPKPTGEESQLENLVNIWKLGHPGQQPPDQVMVQLRKEAYGLRDNPVAPKTVTPTEALKETRQLRNDFVRETSAAKTAQTQLALMKSSIQAVKQGAVAAGSQGVLVTFQKILDPTSVVRESEYARSGAGLSLLNRLDGQWMKIKQGGAGVPVSELEKFVALAEQFTKNQAASAKQTKDQIDGIAREYGLKPELITREFVDLNPDVSTPDPETAPAKPVSTSGATRKIGRFAVTEMKP